MKTMATKISMKEMMKVNGGVTFGFNPLREVEGPRMAPGVASMPPLSVAGGK